MKVQAQSHEQINHYSAMFYKKIQISDEIANDEKHAGAKTGCETGSSESEAQKHMNDIQEFINFNESDSDDDTDNDGDEISENQEDEEVSDKTYEINVDIQLNIN